MSDEGEHSPANKGKRLAPLRAAADGECEPDMYRTSHWRVFIESGREPGARPVVDDVLAALCVKTNAVTLEPYHRGGHLAVFQVEHPPA